MTISETDMYFYVKDRSRREIEGDSHRSRKTQRRRVDNKKADERRMKGKGGKRKLESAENDTIFTSSSSTANIDGSRSLSMEKKKLPKERKKPLILA